MKTGRKQIYVAGTFDTKGGELSYLRQQLADQGLPVACVDLSTSGEGHGADIAARQVAEHHPQGAAAVFTGDRGSAIVAMATAFTHFLAAQDDVGAVLGLGGSGGTALVTPAMQALPVGVPKLMVSTMASGNVAPYVGATDIAMMYSVTDVSGLNRISARILSNAAGAIGGAFRQSQSYRAGGDDRPALGLSMFGVTTPCVQQVTGLLERDYDCLVFHATGTGGQSMEKLLDSGLLSGLLDLTTTEVCDHLFGGVLACTDDRFGATARTRTPYVGSCGALDMVNFGAYDTVPERYKGRIFYEHNPQVTLMRTTEEENRKLGIWIGERLNLCEGEVRFLLPLKGVSALDAPGQAFHAPQADAALFAALQETVRQTPRRQLIALSLHINDPEFAQVAAEEFKKISGGK